MKTGSKTYSSFSRKETILYYRILWRLIPFLGICYLFAYLDRINIGFAKLQMSSDLNLSEEAYGLGAGLFFIGYILIEVPSNVLLERLGAKIWIARIMISWGFLSGATAFVTDKWQFYAVRVLLGAAEAGFLPGILFYLTGWFPSNWRSRAFSLFMIGVPLSSIVGGPLSGWIIEHFHNFGGLHGWQWLFLLEGVPTLILGIAVVVVLPDSPHVAAWLTDDEKLLLSRSLQSDKEELESMKSNIFDGILDLRVWMLGGVDFSLLLCTYAIAFWLPTFIRNAGVVSPVEIGLLVAIPSVATLAGMIIIGSSSDYMEERRWHIIIPFMFGGFALLLSTFFAGNVVMLVITFSVASALITGAVPVVFSLPSTFLRGAAAASGFAVACSVANIAGLIGSSLIGLALQWTGSSSAAIWLFAGCLFLSAGLVFAFPSKPANR
ncbi:MFS family permease [Methylobacterium sp. OAE515]|uniref:MFS transporter n=1 Tax=Methylobacterium sp. OAE515 TaxID=2817895 RepID=UPI00178BDA6C